MTLEFKPSQDADNYQRAINNAERWFADQHRDNPAYTNPGLDSMFIAWMLKEHRITVVLETLERAGRVDGTPGALYLQFMLQAYSSLEKLTMFKLKWG